MRFTRRIKNALENAAASAAAGDGMGDGDISAVNFDAMPDALDWVNSLPTDGAVVALTKTEIRALVRLVNAGIGSTDVVEPKEKIAIRALGKIINAAGKEWDQYAGCVRTNL